MPKRYRGKEVVVEFVNDDDFTATSEERCYAWSLEIGDAVSDHLKISDGSWWYIAAEKDIAEQLLAIPKGAKVKVRALTSFGTSESAEYTEVGTIRKKEVEIGLLVKEILSVGEAPPKA